MNSTLTIYQIKPGQIEPLMALIKEVNQKKEEALSGLKEAHMFVESIFIHDNRLYVLKVCEDINLMKERQSGSQLDLYKPIREVMAQCLEPVSEVNSTAGFYNL